MTGVTERLAEYVSRRNYDDFSAEEITVAKQCLLDYFGVTMAGRDEPLVRIIRKRLLAEGGNRQSSLVGDDRMATSSQAALINGSAAHAHDYDDVHTSMSGHPTVPVAPAVLALAEREGKSGRELIQALVAGLDAECLLGRYVGGSHYARGFHATGTLGCFGAAAACANLLGLDVETTRRVLGIAATQASGLKSMFGTMCKPFHAGKAASNGLLAAELAAGGFDSQMDSLEVAQGFALTHSDAPSADDFEKALASGNFVPSVLFKYHAACYLTHSAMEGMKHLLSENAFAPDEVDSVTLNVDKGHFSVCNIQEPKTGLEAKFSLRFTAAMILHGIDTANIAGYTDELTHDPALVATRDKVSVVAHEVPSRDTHVRVRLKDGRVLETDWNVAVAEKDLDLQWRKLTDKFRSLSVPVVGDANSRAIVDTLAALDGANALDGLFRSVRGA